MKKIFAFPMALFLLVFVVPVYAQGNEPAVPPKPGEGTYILDNLDWLDDNQEQEIASKASALDNAGLAEIFVVTLDDCGTDKVSYRKRIFSEWGVGHADRDGLLILVCWYGGDKSRRSVEQEFGGGLENVLSSSLTDRIAKDYLIPEFNKGNPGQGLLAMIAAYDSTIRYGQQNQQPQSDDGARNDYSDFWFVVALIAVVAFTVFRERVFGSSGGYYSDRESGGGSDRGGGDGGGSSTRF